MPDLDLLCWALWIDNYNIKWETIVCVFDKKTCLKQDEHSEVNFSETVYCLKEV